MARDRDVRNALQVVLQNTGQFDNVYVSGLPEDYGIGSDRVSIAVIEPVSSTERDDWDSETTGGILIQGTAQITLLARQPDPQLRDEAVELLLEYTANTVNGQSLAGLTLPPWTRITAWRWLPATHPERRIQATFQYSYIVEGWGSLDETP